MLIALWDTDVNTLRTPLTCYVDYCAAYWTAAAAAVLFSFTLRSLRPLGVGEELTISYGAEKPNCEALRDYGFVLTGNRHDRIRFGTTTTAAETPTADNTSSQAAAGLDGLNEACLLEVCEYLVFCVAVCLNSTTGPLAACVQENKQQLDLCGIYAPTAWTTARVQ